VAPAPRVLTTRTEPRARAASSRKRRRGTWSESEADGLVHHRSGYPGAAFRSSRRGRLGVTRRSVEHPGPAGCFPRVALGGVETKKRSNRGEVAGYCYRGQRRRRRCEPTPQSAHRSRSCHARGNVTADRSLSQVGGVASGLRHSEASKQPYVQQRVFQSSGMLLLFVANPVFPTMEDPILLPLSLGASHGMFRFARKTEKQVDWSGFVPSYLAYHAFHMCVLTTKYC